MQLTRLAAPLFLLAVLTHAQVLPPDEIQDPNMRELQKQHWGELKQITAAIAKHDFAYPYYFSRKLDLSEAVQRGSDQRSIQFDRYRDQTVLKITGNYFASYSAELMKPEERARQTYQDVMLPLLEASVTALGTANTPEAFAFEISHHVRSKVLGVSSEAAENVVLIVPKASALRLVAATDAQTRQAAILDGQVFLNAKPIELWPESVDQVPVVVVKEQVAPRNPPARTASLLPISALPTAGAVRANILNPVKVANAVVAPERDSSPEALKNIQTTYQASLDRIVEELNTQAHFVRYGPPAFIPFHKGRYLQLSVTTTLPEGAFGSQYRLAAMAFDQHIVRLIRPTLEYFKEDRGDFDGIDFSTTVRVGDDKKSEGSSLAVEFIFPLNMLRLYKQFDCTGQMLIDSGFVLINGERVGLDLQMAEAVAALR